MARSAEQKERRDRVIRERIPSVTGSLLKAGVKDFKILDFSVVFEINSRKVEFFIYTGTIIWEGKETTSNGKGIRRLVELIREEKKLSAIDAYR